MDREISLEGFEDIVRCHCRECNHDVAVGRMTLRVKDYTALVVELECGHKRIKGLSRGNETHGGRKWQKDE
jgi:hypothetical protein